MLTTITSSNETLIVSRSFLCISPSFYTTPDLDSGSPTIFLFDLARNLFQRGLLSRLTCRQNADQVRPINQSTPRRFLIWTDTRDQSTDADRQGNRARYRTRLQGTN